MKRVTVSEAAKVEREVVRQGLVPAEHWGAAWGRAVHRAIEGFGRGRRGENLRAYVSAIVEDEGLAAENVEMLLAILERLERSEHWRALVAGSIVRFELPVMLADSQRGQLMEGVVDAAILGPAGWQVLDWKTDMSDADWEERQHRYTAQVELYATLLEASTGSPANSSLVRVLPPGEM
jgi:ATP-dependent exoDNAse (exonuclease V) beta subunit